MKTYDPQAMYSEWTSQLSNQNNWQEWMMPAKAFLEMPMRTMLKDLGAELDTATLSKLQSDYLQEFGGLWQNFLSSSPPVFEDKRFSSSEWHSQSTHSYTVSSYLLNARFLMSMADAVDAPEKIKQKIRFAVQQMIDAMSPANFLVSNPEAQLKLIESKGESLVKGISLMLADMQKGRISQTDESAFQIGKNVATTAGTVVFENKLFQLIQYSPLTTSVHQRPLLMVPPCINKFYILDLQPENSVVRYAIEQGHTVFLVSWANPDESMSDVTWSDYIEDGAIKAIHVAQEISKQEKINAFGFCVGGTIISTALAILGSRGENPISSLTLLTTLLDFSDTGILDVFIDEEQVAKRESSIGADGLLPGRELASTFSSLRANDLVWNYVQKNYLKGEAPPPFDLLYWNADSTNLPGPMFCWYLRNAYLEDSLKIPNKLRVAGELLDLGKIDAPVFIYGSREDHIVPWQAAFASTFLLNPKRKNRNRFILGASGHIAGVVNPPAKKKRSYWMNAEICTESEKWMAGATEYPGSWWPEWANFLAEHAGKLIKAPTKAGSASYPPIEAAPGRYVAVRAE
ncbi:class I poly(R)-hydroxyalkanoic acid synthase [Undibacterium sp.]|uniref:class I poly(R)-hydroxyalkanoic acid synthase n=1 Tax=Undibacterium sp. TaxID=1914977 RepID=UPI0025E01AD9|nr:class I poly(R)-hydroxyalkanoic acid synthase [Undibacterium sp.]